MRKSRIEDDNKIKPEIPCFKRLPAERPSNRVKSMFTWCLLLVLLPLLVLGYFTTPESALAEEECHQHRSRLGICNPISIK